MKSQEFKHQTSYYSIFKSYSPSHFQSKTQTHFNLAHEQKFQNIASLNLIEVIAQLSQKSG